MRKHHEEAPWRLVKHSAHASRQTADATRRSRPRARRRAHCRRRPPSETIRSPASVFFPSSTPGGQRRPAIRRTIPFSSENGFGGAHGDGPFTGRARDGAIQPPGTDPASTTVVGAGSRLQRAYFLSHPRRTLVVKARETASPVSAFRDHARANGPLYGARSALAG